MAQDFSDLIAGHGDKRVVHKGKGFVGQARIDHDDARSPKLLIALASWLVSARAQRSFRLLSARSFCESRCRISSTAIAANPRKESRSVWLISRGWRSSTQKVPSLWPSGVIRGAPRVKANVQLPGHDRIIEKTRVQRRIRHHHDLIAEDRVRAERNRPRRLRRLHPAAGLEPLPVRIDQRDEGDRRVKHPRGRARPNGRRPPPALCP